MFEPAYDSQIPSPGGPIYHLQEYYYRLGLGDRNNIARAFRGLPLIADPRFGEVTDWPGYEAYVSDSAAWLASVQARFTPCETTLSTSRHILEGRLNLEVTEPHGLLLVLLAGEVFAGGMNHLRIYHGLESTGLSPHPRSPLPPNPGIILPDAAANFIQRLADGQPDLLRQSFTKDARLVSPQADTLDDFEKVIKEREPQFWQPCTLTSSGYRHALEYNLRPPESLRAMPGGCAVFEISSDGLIQRLRIYPVLNQ